MVAVVALDRLRRAGAAAHPGAVRQARRRPPGLRRAEHVPAAARQHRRRHPDHLRDLDPPAARATSPDSRRRGLDEEGGELALAGAAALHPALRASGIIFFCYFYTSIVFNPTDTADNMRKYGGFIPGIRPGKKTADYIDTVLSRITIVGAVYLTFVALLPDFLAQRLQGRRASRGIGPWLDGAPAAVLHAGLRLQLLLRRHVAPDRRRRRHGHGPAGRVEARRAPLHRAS